MTLRTWSLVVLTAGYAGLVGVGSWANKPAPAVPTAVAIQDKASSKGPKLYFGVAGCGNASCHDNPSQKDTILCDCNEVQVWSERDKHKDANTVLTGERAQQMAKLLGIVGDIAREKACISCHGVVVEDEKVKHSSFRLEDGVSCVACHGAYKKWISLHGIVVEFDEWRKKSRAEKEKDYGMADLWDPEKRATLCASCHIGNAEQKKVVTHDMYAAGHPPLPGIETAAFSDAMPRHWKYLAEKSRKVQTILGYEGDLERTQLVVIGGLVSLRESMKLMAAQATQDGGKKWPEFAQLDCYACHHDLKSPSWRQLRGYNGKPGRPDMRPWPLALAQLGTLHAAKGDAEEEKRLLREMHDKVKALSDVFAAQPFGDPEKVAKAAEQVSKWAEKMLERVHPREKADAPKAGIFDRGAAGRMLAGLGKESKNRLLDFDSARQVAWASRSIQRDLDGKSAADPEITKLHKELAAQLQLDLPDGRKEIAGDFLKETLEKLNNYEPERFQRAFERLTKLRAEPAK